jgi:hypothetical protein
MLNKDVKTALAPLPIALIRREIVGQSKSILFGRSKSMDL